MILAAVALALAAPASAAPGPVQALEDHLDYSTAAFVSPSTATYARATGVVDNILIERVNVFDPRVPGEDWWPFLLANRIHVLTREPVIRRELLLRPGEPFNPLLALESERNLRASGFIRQAEIHPVPRGGDKLDLLVHTQDSWTLAPQFNVGTEGGSRYLAYGVSESNLLGYGKSVSLFHSSFGDLHRDEARYFDPRLGGSRQRLTSLYARTNKGDEIGAMIDRPFYSLYTPYSTQLLWTRIIQQDILYQNADEYSKFLQRFDSAQANAGMRVGSSDDLIQRVLAGAPYEKDRFESTPDTMGSLPQDRTLSGPVAGYSLIQPRYTKETYINSMARVEDFNMGNEFSLTGGPLPKSWGSDRDRWMFGALEQQGWHIDEGRFVLGQIGAVGRVAGGQFENALAYGSLNAFWKTLWPIPQTWVVHGEANAGRRLDAEHQLVLGGNTGLRGYKNNSFVGDTSALVNIEDRVFLPRELWHLVYIGGVAFFETGALAPQAWGFAGSRFRSDVGIGFRLAPSRSTTGSVLRMDLAYALERGPGPSRWVVSIRGGQAFQIFNSTNRDVVRTPAAQLGEDSAGTRLRHD